MSDTGGQSSALPPVCLGGTQAQPGTGLSFLDLLYAVDVGEVATRLSDARLDKVALSQWGAVAVVMSLIILSWIGYHRDRAKVTSNSRDNRRPPGDFGFFEIRFMQFTVEIAIIAAYFVMAIRLRFPGTSPHQSDPSAQFEALWVLIVFALYLVWDVFDVCIADDRVVTGWKSMARHYRRITIVATVTFAVLLGSVSIGHPEGSGTVFAIEMILVALIYLYRAAQDPGDRSSSPTAAVS